MDLLELNKLLKKIRMANSVLGLRPQYYLGLIYGQAQVKHSQ